MITKIKLPIKRLIKEEGGKSLICSNSSNIAIWFSPEEVRTLEEEMELSINHLKSYSISDLYWILHEDEDTPQGKPKRTVYIGAEVLNMFGVQTHLKTAFNYLT